VESLPLSPGIAGNQGTLFEASATEPKRPTRPYFALARYPTGKYANALGLAFTRSVFDIVANTTVGEAAVGRLGFGDGQILFAPPPDAARLAALFPGIDAPTARHLAAKVATAGRTKGALVTYAAIDFAARYDGMTFSRFDLREHFGCKRPGGKITAQGEAAVKAYYDAFDRELLVWLLLGETARYYGSVSPDGSGGTDIFATYSLGHIRLDRDGLLDRVRCNAVGLSEWQRDHPDQLQSLGFVRDLLALPDTTAGKWATAMAMFLIPHWRMKVSTKDCVYETRAGRHVLTFRPLLTTADLFSGKYGRTPDPPTMEQILCRGAEWKTPDGSIESCEGNRHPGRAVGYFADAIALLKGGPKEGGEHRYAKIVSSWTSLPTRYAKQHGREPWPVLNPDGTTAQRAIRGVDWRTAFYGERKHNIRPGGAYLDECMEHYAAKHPKLGRGSKWRP
jgi:hypothetical protein